MKKVDQLTKTRREIDTDNVSGHMSENSEMSEYSPVRHFETYLEKRHPQCNRLCQFPMNIGSKAHIMADDTNLPRQLPQPQGIYIYHKSGMSHYIPYGYLIAE
jgi:hypothetical protein